MQKFVAVASTKRFEETFVLTAKFFYCWKSVKSIAFRSDFAKFIYNFLYSALLLFTKLFYYYSFTQVFSLQHFFSLLKTSSPLKTFCSCPHLPLTRLEFMAQCHTHSPLKLLSLLHLLLLPYPPGNTKSELILSST